MSYTLDQAVADVRNAINRYNEASDGPSADDEHEAALEVVDAAEALLLAARNHDAKVWDQGFEAGHECTGSELAEVCTSRQPNPYLPLTTSAN